MPLFWWVHLEVPVDHLFCSPITLLGHDEDKETQFSPSCASHCICVKRCKRVTKLEATKWQVGMTQLEQTGGPKIQKSNKEYLLRTKIRSFYRTHWHRKCKSLWRCCDLSYQCIAWVSEAYMDDNYISLTSSPSTTTQQDFKSLIIRVDQYLKGNIRWIMHVVTISGWAFIDSLPWSQFPQIWFKWKQGFAPTKLL